MICNRKYSQEVNNKHIKIHNNSYVLKVIWTSYLASKKRKKIIKVIDFVE